MDLFIFECFNSIRHVEMENSKFIIDLFENEKHQYTIGTDDIVRYYKYFESIFFV